MKIRMRARPETPIVRAMDANKDPAAAPPQDWTAALHESRQDLAAGRTLAAGEVHARFANRLHGAMAPRQPPATDAAD
jgi:hypothetical protein